MRNTQLDNDEFDGASRHEPGDEDDVGDKTKTSQEI